MLEEIMTRPRVKPIDWTFTNQKEMSLPSYYRSTPSSSGDEGKTTDLPQVYSLGRKERRTVAITQMMFLMSNRQQF